MMRYFYDALIYSYNATIHVHDAIASLYDAFISLGLYNKIIHANDANTSLCSTITCAHGSTTNGTGKDGRHEENGY